MSKNDLNSIIIQVQGLTKPLRLDVFLSQHLESTSRSLAGKIITNSFCELNGKTITRSSTLVNNEDTVKVLIPQTQKTTLEPQKLPLDIVYEDEDLIVVNKAFGMVVHPSNGHPDHTLVNALLYHCKNLSMGFHEHRPGIVHRLDKETGGLIVVAKNQPTHIHLAEQFKNKTAGRIYKAFTFNKFKLNSGTIETHLTRHPKNRMKFASSHNPKVGKFARTHYEVLINGPVSLVKLQLDTGRTHQIRVHLSEMGNPIIHDDIYTSVNMVNNIQDSRLKSNIKKISNMLLFAEELHLIHPKTKKDLVFKVPLPLSFENLINFMNEQNYTV